MSRQLEVTVVLKATLSDDQDPLVISDRMCEGLPAPYDLKKIVLRDGRTIVQELKFTTTTRRRH